jgi:hypothetical protein
MIWGLKNLGIAISLFLYHHESGKSRYKMSNPRRITFIKGGQKEFLPAMMVGLPQLFDF